MLTCAYRGRQFTCKTHHAHEVGRVPNLDRAQNQQNAAMPAGSKQKAAVFARSLSQKSLTNYREVTTARSISQRQKGAAPAAASNASTAGTLANLAASSSEGSKRRLSARFSPQKQKVVAPAAASNASSAGTPTNLAASRAKQSDPASSSEDSKRRRSARFSSEQTGALINTAAVSKASPTNPKAGSSEGSKRRLSARFSPDQLQKPSTLDARPFDLAEPKQAGGSKAGGTNNRAAPGRSRVTTPEPKSSPKEQARQIREMLNKAPPVEEFARANYFERLRLKKELQTTRLAELEQLVESLLIQNEKQAATIESLRAQVRSGSRWRWFRRQRTKSETV